MLLLSAGTAPRQGVEFTIPAGQSMSIFITPATGVLLDDFAVANFSVDLLRKTEAGAYFYRIDDIQNGEGSKVLYAAGTYRIDAVDISPITISVEGFLG
jgi:hypothetical protein